MIKNYILKINSHLNDKFLFTIILITFILSIIKINFLPISLQIDAYGYFSFSDNLFLDNPWESRPIGYAIFLKIGRIIPYFGLTFIIFFQLLFYIASSTLIYLCFKEFNNFIAFIFAIFFALNPAFQWININLVADSLYTFFPIFITYFFFKYFKNKKQTDFFLIFIIAFIISINRPTYLVFFYLIVFLFIFFFFFKNNNENLNISIKIIIKVLILCVLSLILFSNVNSKYSKNYGIHQLWLWNVSTSMCENIKCFNINNGFYSKKYFKIVSEVISKDSDFKKVLSSRYDYKDSPTTIDNELYKLDSIELLKRVHLTTNHTPFVHIYGFLVNNIGFEKTHKLIRNVSIETFAKNPSLIFRNLINFYNFKNLFNTDLKLSTQVFKEGMYFSILPKPYKTIEEQGMTHLEKITPKEYAQMIYGLEKFTGTTIKKYNKNKKKFYDLHKKLDNYLFVKEKYYEDQNYGFIILYFLAYFNLFYLIIFKLFILIILPIYSVICFTKIILYKKYSEKDFIYFLSILIFYSIFIAISILTPDDIDRQINLNLSILFPALIILFIDVFNFLKRKLNYDNS